MQLALSTAAQEDVINMFNLSDAYDTTMPEDVLRMQQEIDRCNLHLTQLCITPGSDISIVIAGKSYNFYDHAALVQSLMSTLEDFRQEL